MSRCTLCYISLSRLMRQSAFCNQLRCSRFGVLNLIPRVSLVTLTVPRRLASEFPFGCLGRSSCKTTPSLHSLIGSYRKSAQILASRYSTKKVSKLPFEKDTNVQQNVLIFQHNNDRFYRLLSFFGSVQLLFWGYLSFFSFSTLRDVPVDDSSSLEKEKPWWRLLNLGNNKYKNGIALLCVSVGYVIFFISVMYPLRAVQSLWLLKGGNSVGFTTYAPFGKKVSFVAQLENINCVQSRAQAVSQVPIKVKDKWFFFLLDKKGTFHNPELFDYAVGLNRKL